MILHLHLQEKQWELIKKGIEKTVYVPVSTYWKKRLKKRIQEYTEIWLYCGKSRRQKKILKRRWTFMWEEKITSGRPGTTATNFFCIDVSNEL